VCDSSLEALELTPWAHRIVSGGQGLAHVPLLLAYPEGCLSKRGRLAFAYRAHLIVNANGLSVFGPCPSECQSNAT
jgi:hypothetical protein